MQPQNLLPKCTLVEPDMNRIRTEYEPNTNHDECGERDKEQRVERGGLEKEDNLVPDNQLCNYDVLYLNEIC